MSTTKRPPTPLPTRTGRHATGRRSSRTPDHKNLRQRLWILGAAAAVVGVLFLVFLAGRSGGGSSASGDSGSSAYAVASPAAGAQAPGFTLSSTTGGTVSLDSYRGRTVLLFFQEGIGCEPCWQQVKDLESQSAKLKSSGIDALVTVTTNTLDQLTQKAGDEGLTTPVLADTDFAVSTKYNANAYGMMGHSADGHTFVVVGPDGTIRWRADYGGPPNYTMYVPLDQLLSDMRQGSKA